MELVRLAEKVAVTRVFEWHIKDFFALSAEADAFYCSPPFVFADVSWYLEIYPNGQTKVTFIDGREESTVGHIGVTLFYESSGPPIALEFSFGIKTLDKKLDPEYHYASIFESTKGHGAAFLIRRSDLLERKSQLILSDVLTIVCKLRKAKYMENAIHHNASGHYSYFFKNGDISKWKRKFMDRPVKHPSKSDIVSLEGCLNDHECENKNNEVYYDASLNCSHSYENVDRPMKCPDCAEVVSLYSWLNDHECQNKRTEECCYCKKYVDAENILMHEDLCMGRLSEFPDCLDMLLLQE